MDELRSRVLATKPNTPERRKLATAYAKALVGNERMVDAEHSWYLWTVSKWTHRALR